MNQKRQWAFQLSVPNIVLLVSALAINILGKWVSACFSLPFWLDTVGTIFAAGLLGPFAGVLVGGVSGCLNAAFASVTAIYAVTGICVGLVVGYFYQEDALDLFQILCSGAIVAISAVLVTTPVNIIYYSGYTQNLWGDALIDMMLQGGNSRLFSYVLGEALVDIPDKVISVFFAAGAEKVWCRFYPAGKKGAVNDEK